MGQNGDNSGVTKTTCKLQSPSQNANELESQSNTENIKSGNIIQFI